MTTSCAAVAPQQEYYTSQEIAQLCRCCVQTVKNWQKKSILPQPIIVGGKKLYPADAVRALLRKKEGAAE